MIGNGKRKEQGNFKVKLSHELVKVRALSSCHHAI